MPLKKNGNQDLWGGRWKQNSGVIFALVRDQVILMLNYFGFGFGFGVGSNDAPSKLFFTNE